MWGSSRSADNVAPTPGTGGGKSSGGMSSGGVAGGTGNRPPSTTTGTGGTGAQYPTVVPRPSTSDGSSYISSSGKIVRTPSVTGASLAPRRSNSPVSPLNVSGTREAPGEGGRQATGGAESGLVAAAKASDDPSSSKPKVCGGVAGGVSGAIADVADAVTRDSRPLSAPAEALVPLKGTTRRGGSDRSSVSAGGSGDDRAVLAPATVPPATASEVSENPRKQPSVGAAGGAGAGASGTGKISSYHSFVAAGGGGGGGDGAREHGVAKEGEVSAAPAPDAQDATRRSSGSTMGNADLEKNDKKLKFYVGAQTDGGDQDRSARADVGSMEMPAIMGTRAEEDAITDGGFSSTVGKSKKPVATRFGGRTRTPSVKYQEFKEVQQTKAKGAKRGCLNSGVASSSAGAEDIEIDDSHNTNRLPQTSSSSSTISDVAGLHRPGSEDPGVELIDAEPEKGQQSTTTLIAVGGSIGARGGMGDLAAAAQVARRDRRIDTVVLAKCRRKSQTMWPARLCSKREILGRLADPEPADHGVDPRYMCLVVFLCEGGHHVTDWVTPASLRPYLSHAAAYPHKKRAYAGTARLQPDFTAAEAWAEELKSIMVMRRAKARDVRRAEVIKDREEKSQQAKLEDGKSFPAIENVAAAAVEQGSGIGKRATAGNAVIGDDMGDSELSARPVKSEENATVAADDARDARDPISSADVFSGTAAATSRVTGATVMQDGTRTGKSAMAATTAPAAREVTPQVINVAEAHGGTAGEGSAGYSTRLINTEAITGGAQEGGASTGAAPASAARGGSEFWNKGVKATAVSSVAAAVTPSADARVNQDRGKKVHQGVLLKKRMLSSGWERDVDGGVDTTVGRRGDRVEEEYEEEKRPRKRPAFELNGNPSSAFTAAAASTASAAVKLDGAKPPPENATPFLPTASPPPTAVAVAPLPTVPQQAKTTSDNTQASTVVVPARKETGEITVGSAPALPATTPAVVINNARSIFRSVDGGACPPVSTAGSTGSRGSSRDADGGVDCGTVAMTETAAHAAVAALSQDDSTMDQEQEQVPVRTTANGNSAGAFISVDASRSKQASATAPLERGGGNVTIHQALGLRSTGSSEGGGSREEPPVNARKVEDVPPAPAPAVAGDGLSFDKESSVGLTAPRLGSPAASGVATPTPASGVGVAKETAEAPDLASRGPKPQQRPLVPNVPLGEHPDSQDNKSGVNSNGDNGTAAGSGSQGVSGTRNPFPVTVSGSQLTARVASSAAAASAAATRTTERVVEGGNVFDSNGRSSAPPRAVSDDGGVLRQGSGEKTSHRAAPGGTAATTNPGPGVGYGMPGGFGPFKFNMTTAAPAAAMHPYGRGFYRAWQEGSNPHPPHHAYPAPFSPYGRYPPMGPSGGYGFASPTAAFFGSFPPTAPGYPPHHVGRPAHFPPAYGAAGMPYGGQGGAARGDGRGGLEARMASPEGGGIMGGMLDQGQGNGNRGRIEGFRGEGQRSEEEMRRGTHGSLPLGRSGDGYGQASGEAGRQSNPVTAAAVHAVAAQVAAHAAAVVTNRPDWRNPWHDSWRGGGGPGIGGVPGFAAAALASGGLSSLVSPEGDDQGDDEVKPSETADPRNALSNMLDEDPSERRRKCDHDGCLQMATHGFILPRLCGQHKEARMLRIVPPDVDSGDEWGSDAEADARDFGRFRRIAGADRETMLYALKLYPPRSIKTRDRIYAVFELGPPPIELSSTAGVVGSPKSGGFSVASRGNRGGRQVRGGAGLAVEGAGGALKDGPGSGSGDGSGADREDIGVTSSAAVDVEAEAASQALPTNGSTSAKPTRVKKNDHALLASYGIRKPKGKHPGYIVTLFGKKVKRCGSCQLCVAADCGNCRHCKDMTKFGGKGFFKQPCENRKCAWVEYDRRARAVLTQLHSQQKVDENSDGNGDGGGGGGGEGVDGGSAASPRAKGVVPSSLARSPRSSVAGSPTSRTSSQGSVRGRPRSKTASPSVPPSVPPSIPRGASRKPAIKARKRCGDCAGCTAAECGNCKFCKDMPKNGGPGRSRQVCIDKRCIALVRTPTRGRSSRMEVEIDEDLDEERPASEEEDDSGDEGGAGSAFRDEAFETTEEGGDLEGEQEALDEEDRAAGETDVADNSSRVGSEGGVVDGVVENVVDGGDGNGDDNVDGVDSVGGVGADGEGSCSIVAGVVAGEGGEESIGPGETGGEGVGEDAGGGGVGGGDGGIIGIGDSVDGVLDQADREAEEADPHFHKMHMLNYRSLDFESEALECPWECRGCLRRSTSCGCPEGFPAWLDSDAGQTRQSQLGKYTCRGGPARCGFCRRGPGHLILLGDWARDMQDKLGGGGSGLRVMPRDRMAPAKAARTTNSFKRRGGADDMGALEDEDGPLPDADQYARGYRSRVGVSRKRGKRDLDEDASTAAAVAAAAGGRNGRGQGRPRLSAAGTTMGGGRLSGSGSLDTDRAMRSWSGSVEVRLTFTGRRFFRLRLDNYPVDESIAATAEEGIPSGGKAVKGFEENGKGVLARTASEASAAGAPTAISSEPGDRLAPADIVAVRNGAAEQKVFVEGAAASAGSGAGKEIFTPTPLAGPRPALARGGWASLTATTAAATGVADQDNSGGGSGSDRGNNSAADGKDGRLGLPGTWANRPLSVLRSLRALLLPSLTGDEKCLEGLDEGGKETTAEGAEQPSALVSLLEDGTRTTSLPPEGGEFDYAGHLRTDALEQLSGKMRLLLCADLVSDGGGGGVSRNGADTGEVPMAARRLGLGEFISLLEDVHRSLERTTRQRHDTLMQRRKASREDCLGKLKERLRRLDSKRGAIRSDLDRLRRRMSSKADRIKTLRALADECWAEGEPSVSRGTLDTLESMVRKEKSHLTKFRGRVKELEAHANQTEALLSGVKEDKVRRLADADRREREAEASLLEKSLARTPANKDTAVVVVSPSSTSPPSEATSASGSDDPATSGGGATGTGSRKQASEGLGEGDVARPPSKSSKGADGSKTARVTLALPSEPNEQKRPGAGGGSSSGVVAGDKDIGDGTGEDAQKTRSEALPGGKDSTDSTCVDERGKIGVTEATAAASAAAALKGRKNNASPVAEIGAGAVGARFMQRDVEAAELMIRARRLDLAAREWVGVRGLLLRRATAAAAGGSRRTVANSDLNVNEGSRVGGCGGQDIEETGTTLSGSVSVTVGGGLDRSNGGAKNDSESGIGPVISARCTKTLVLRPSMMASKGEEGDGEGLAPVAELESVLEVLAEKGHIVRETPAEEGDGDSGVGWGGWDSGANEKQYLAQAHTQEFLKHMSARGWDAWGPTAASAACVVRGVSAILAGKFAKALCLVETPGRHAPSGGCSVGQGGPPEGRDGWPCSVNSIAIGALFAHLQWAVGRVAVVDLDAHLGSGTADILCRTLDPAFLYASIAVSDGCGVNNGATAHEHALRLVETPGAKGILGGNGERLTRQLLESGVPRESGGTGVGAISVLASALEAFRPDLVMISAGLDGRKGHPCGLGDLVAKDYEWITSEIVKMAERLCGGRLVSVLERRCLGATAQVTVGAPSRQGSKNAVNTDAPYAPGSMGLRPPSGGGSKGKGKSRALTNVEMEVEEEDNEGEDSASREEEKGAKRYSCSVGELDCLEGHVRGLRLCGAERGGMSMVSDASGVRSA